jgi:hypothetical protein
MDTVILRCALFLARLEGWPQALRRTPSFEGLARVRPPQDDGKKVVTQYN